MLWKHIKPVAIVASGVVLLGGNGAIVNRSSAGEPDAAAATVVRQAAGTHATNNNTITIDGCRLTILGQQLNVGRFAGRGAFMPGAKTPIFNAESGVTVFLTLDNTTGSAQHLQWQAALLDAVGKEIPLRPEQWQSQLAQIEAQDGKGVKDLRPWDGSIAKGESYALRLLFFVNTKDLGLNEFAEDPQAAGWQKTYRITVKFKNAKVVISTLTTAEVKPTTEAKPQRNAARLTIPPPP